MGVIRHNDRHTKQLRNYQSTKYLKRRCIMFSSVHFNYSNLFGSQIRMFFFLIERWGVLYVIIYTEQQRREEYHDSRGRGVNDVWLKLSDLTYYPRAEGQ
jgi:hypothetical protein